MDKLKIVKGVANILTGATVGKTVDIFIKNNIPTEFLSGRKERLAVMVGSAIIGAFVSAKCSDYVEGEIDDIAKSIEEIKQNVKISKEENTVVINNVQITSNEDSTEDTDKE